MPDRIIRDELLTSEAYWSVSPEARNLFVSIILTVDDAARMTGSPFALRTRCMASTVSHERIAVILAELIDAKLVVQYAGPDRKPYLFLPKSRQRKRYFASSKHPEPPKEINDIESEKSDSSMPESDSSQPQDERSRSRSRSRSKPKPGVKGLVTPPEARANPPATLNPILKVGPTIQALTLTPTRKTNDDLERERKRQLDEIAKRVKP